MDKNSKIYIAGHRGMVGSAIKRKLESLGYNNLIYLSSKEMDLRNQKQANEFFEKNKPEYVFLCAAKVGGINANNIYPADFMYDNLAIQNNVIYSSYKHGVKKLLYFGSVCIYPKLAKNPIKEESILSGYLESTNEAYAIAKIAGLKMCKYFNTQYGCNFISVMPNNLYGFNDNYDLQNSHVLPALLKKTHFSKANKEKKVVIWGTGKPRREFVHADDLADASLFLMDNYNNQEFVNIGSGEDISIKDLALLIKDIVGFRGEIEFDTSKLDGTMEKKVDTSKMKALGWEPKITLKKGIEGIYADKLKNWSNL